MYVYDHLTGEYEVYNSRNSSLSVNSVFSLKADFEGQDVAGHRRGRFYV